METSNQTISMASNDLFDPQPKGMTGTLKTLSILSLIGCGLSYVMGIYSLIDSSNYDKKMAEFEKAQDQIGDNQLANDMLQSSIDIFQKTYDYRYILFATTILFTTLCLIGVLQMRKLKKSGFTFIGVAFVVMYASQRKYMLN